MTVTDRDLALLYYLWQNQFTSVQQVCRRFWGGRSRNAVSMRLAALEAEGLVRVVANRYVRVLSKERRMVIIGLAGLNHLIKNEILPPDRAKDTPAASSLPSGSYAPELVHDLEVVEVRIALELSLSVESWTSDHQLRIARQGKGRSVRTADGLFRFSTASGELEAVLENEKKPYTAKKFEAILTLLKIQHPQAFVLVTTVTAHRAETLRAWAQAAGVYADHEQRVLVATYDDVAEHGAGADWRSSAGPLPKGHALRRGMEHFRTV